MRYPLKVPTSKDKIYNQFLRIVNFLVYEKDTEGDVQRSPLTNKELDVLASMMYYNDRYRNLPPVERAEYIMSSDIRKRIRAKLDIKANHLNNVISRLKTKYYMGAPILDDGKLCQSLNIYLDSDTTIEFSLSYEEPTPKPDRPAEEPSRKVQLKVRQSEGTPRTGGDVVKPFNLDD
tara:strand:+ start:336 stop:866 length:531 start_codon:yes stop_codon:yes gene_type:complete